MKKIILLLAIINLFFSCKKREESIRWNIDAVAPIVHGELSIFDILPDSVLTTNPDSTISINMDLSLYTLDLDSLIRVPDTSLLDTFVLPLSIPITAVPGQVFVNEPEDNIMNLGDAEITYIEVNSGTIEYELTSTIQGKIIYEYQIPVAIDANGNSFSELVYVDAANGSTKASASGSFDLSGYSIDLTGSTGNSFNLIQANVNIKVDPLNGADVNMSNQDTVHLDNSLTNIKIGYAKGYFGNETFTIGPEKEEITAFDKLIGGNIDINQIDVDLELINGIGIDAGILFNELSASNNTSELALSHSIIGNNININRANQVGPTIYPYIYNTNLDESNSNIDYLLELLPDSIGYDLSMEINPLGNISAHNDFISSESPFELNMGISLPLSIIASNLTLADTINIEINDTSDINSIQLNITLENGFPLDAQLDLALLDQNQMVIAHNFSPNLIPAATIDGNGIVSSPSSSIHQLTLSQKDFNTFIKNKKFVLKIIFNTPPSVSHIDIYDYYKLTFNVTADFEYGVEIEAN